MRILSIVMCIIGTAIILILGIYIIPQELMIGLGMIILSLFMGGLAVSLIKQN